MFNCSGSACYRAWMKLPLTQIIFTEMITKKKKTIALVAHDNMKPDLVEWADWNQQLLRHHDMVCTGTTGKMVVDVLKKYHSRDEERFEVRLLKSGPLGGDQQLGAMIAEGKVDAVVFFWDPMQAQPHDVDVKALMRIATLYNVPMAINRSSADFIISSPLFDSDYEPVIKDYSNYIERSLNK